MSSNHIITRMTLREIISLKNAPELKQIVESTLYELGTSKILEILPQLRYLDTWSSERLTSILLDQKNMYYNEAEFRSLAALLQKLRSGQLDEEAERDVDIEKWFKKAELHIGSRDSSAGVTLTREVPTSVPMDIDTNGHEASTSGSGSSSGSQSHAGLGSGNGSVAVQSTFLPLVSIAITDEADHERGPLQTALNTLFLSALHRTQNRNGICTVFLHNILTLWTLIIATWTTPIRPEDPKDAEVCWDPYTIPPVPDYWPESIRNQLFDYRGNLPVGEHVNLSYTFERLNFLKALSFTAGHVTCSQWTSDMRQKKNQLPDGKGSDWLLMLSDDLYPFRPRYPCSAGLAFDWPDSMTLQFEHGKEYTVMSQITSEVAGGGKWRYCGEYRLVSVENKTLGGHAQTLDKWANWIYSNREKSSHPRALEEIGLRNPSLEDIKKAIFSGTLPINSYILLPLDYHEEVQKLVTRANVGKSKATQPIYV